MIADTKCEFCDKSFDSQVILQNHKNLDFYEDVKEETIKLIFKCKVCKFSASTKENFWSHYIDSEQNLKLDCIEGGFRVTPNLSFEDDLKGRRNNKCDECDKKFSKKKYLLIHKQHEHDFEYDGKKCLKCKLCDFKTKYFVGKNGLLAHMETEHSNEKNTYLTCNVCLKEFKHLSSLTSHKRKIHIGVKSDYRYHVCEICNFKFKDIRSLRKHIKDHHEEVGHNSDKVEHAKMHECSICMKTFEKRNKLSDHVRMVHMKGQEYIQCDICGKTTTKIEMKYHQGRVHSTEKPYKCDMCDYAGAFKALLSQHMRNKHALKGNEFTCEVCNKILASKASLANHRLIHSNQKLFKCDQCEYSTNTGDQLRNHSIQIHINAREQKCDECGKAFNLKITLNRHIAKVHKKESCKEFKCDNCDFSTIHDSSLKRHKKSHHEDKTDDTKCGICNSIFKAKASLKSHMKRKHCSNL